MSEFPLSIGKRKIVPFYLILRQVIPGGITFNEKLEGSFYDKEHLACVVHQASFLVPVRLRNLSLESHLGSW